MKRNVAIEVVKKIGGNLWFARFTTTTSTKNIPTPDVIIWHAYLRINYQEFRNYSDIEKTDEEKLNYTINPFGFKVMAYSVAYAGKPEKAYTAIQTAKKVFENLEDVEK